jgi:hypothetical protein
MSARKDLYRGQGRRLRRKSAKEILSHTQAGPAGARVSARSLSRRNKTCGAPASQNRPRQCHHTWREAAEVEATDRCRSGQRARTRSGWSRRRLSDEQRTGTCAPKRPEIPAAGRRLAGLLPTWGDRSRPTPRTGPGQCAIIGVSLLHDDCEGETDRLNAERR